MAKAVQRRRCSSVPKPSLTDSILDNAVRIETAIAMKKTVAALVLFVALQFSAFAQWVEHDGSHYYSPTHKLTWYDAVAWANYLGATPVVVNSPQELQFLRNQFGLTEMFWMGLDEFNGAWQPLDGTPLMYSFFGVGDSTPIFNAGVVFNVPGSRGITKGEFGVRPKSDLFRVIFEKKP